MKAALIGGGVIGGGWAARFLLNGHDVALFDPDPEAPRKVAEVMANARASLPLLSDAAPVPEGRLTFADSIEAACDGADWVGESVPERLDVKHRTLAAIQAVTDAVVGSSTSGFKPSQLQEGARDPSRILVAHPFNPVYLLPLVEVVPSPATAPEAVEAAMAILSSLGMFPLHVRREIDAHIADRFLEAVWREALWLVRDGIATTEEIDESIRMGFGLRWAQMGLFETYRVAGGEAGMRHFMAQFGPCLTSPWTRLTDVPPFDDALVDLIAGQSDQQSGHHTIRELERIRDGNLVAFLRALKERDWGAGKVLNAHDAARRGAAGEGPVRIVVPPSWIDYNGHVNESRYLQASSDTVDALLRAIGAGLDYVKGGHSYYTAETHVRHLGEARVGDVIEGAARVLSHDPKRLHVWVTLTVAGREVATVEQMLLHVDMGAGKAVPAPQALLDAIAARAEGGPAPEGAGRFVGAPR